MHEIWRLLCNARLHLEITYGNKLADDAKIELSHAMQKIECSHANWHISNFDTLVNKSVRNEIPKREILMCDYNEIDL